MKWAVGVTTVPVRADDLLPATLLSLAKAGFAKPHLFVDGCRNGGAFADDLGMRCPELAGHCVTARDPAVMVAGNWVLSLVELIYLFPDAERFAVFQDDVLAPKNLRAYVEACPYPDHGYLGLCLYPNNLAVVPKNPDGTPRAGWFLTKQMGWGAQGLIFSREAAITLLSTRYLAERPFDLQGGYRAIDGGIADAMKGVGWKEWGHWPSLLWHAGKVTSKVHRPGTRPITACQPETPAWLGEDWDALEALKGGRQAAGSVVKAPATAVTA